MNAKGYSLVELLVVVVIVGVLATYATFNYSSSNAKLKNVTRELFGHIQNLKAESVKRNKIGIVKFDKNSEAYSMWFDKEVPPNWSLDSSDDIIVQATLPDVVDLVSTDIPSDTFTFSPLGIADETTLNGINVNPAIYCVDSGRCKIVLKNTENKYLGIRLTIAGSVQVIESTDGGVTWN